MKIRFSINKHLEDWNARIQEAQTLGKSEEYLLGLNRLKNRWQARNDLYFLCKVCGQDKITDPRWRYYYEPFCDEVSLMNWQIIKLGLHPPSGDEGVPNMLEIDEVVDDIRELSMQRLYLAFRTFWKTTIISKIHSLQLLLNFPNIHIVLCHNRQSNASDILVAIKNLFLTTPLRRWFPEYIPDTKEWGNMQGFSVACRTDLGRDEDNIEAVGIDTEITGRHWQVGKKNDLVTEKSVTTDDQLKKTLDWDERFNIGLFDDPQYPLQDYEGTRYHFSDLYSHKVSDSRIKLIKIPLLRNFEDNSSCPIPERFSPHAIKELKETDPWVFWCQHMLEPKDPAKMRFQPEMIAYYTEIPQKGCNYYLLIDPGSARKKKSDYTVMEVVGVGWIKFRNEELPKLRKFIADGLRDKLDPKQRVDEAMRLALKWNIKGLGWEAIAFQSTDSFYFEEKRREYRQVPTPQEIKSHSVSKEDRIRGLMPEYARGEWLWPPKGTLVQMSKFTGKNYDLTEELEYEFLHFPLGEHDDLLDAQTFLHLMNIIEPQPIKDNSEPEGMTFGELTKLRDDRLAALRKNPWQKFYQSSYR